MEKRILNHNWHLEWEGEALSCDVPCSVVSVLLDHQKIEDPYRRDHEKAVQPLFEKDYTFKTTFTVSKEELSARRIRLGFDMLDTLCEIFLNGVKIAEEKSMFRAFRYDVKPYLTEGNNELRLLFHSPVRYLEEHKADLGKPFNVIRKAGCMFGWDWGIKLPDSGILGRVYLQFDEGDECCDLSIAQEHHGHAVRLRVNTEMAVENATHVRFTLKDPSGNELQQCILPAASQTTEFQLETPDYWMPVGYGSQPLYEIEAALLRGDETLDVISRRFGVRKVCLDTAKEGKGHRFGLVVNDVPVYFRGENMIIQDAVIPRITDETWKKLVDLCLESNLNGIRVWGGAYYPPDLFYDLCDEAGLMVYQDFMFACTFYYPSKSLVENITKEVEYQIKRLRNHPCLVLWCGNNELDCLYTAMTSKEPRTVALRKLFGVEKPFDLKTALFIRYIYSKLFLKLIPSLVKRLSPEVPFIHSTPHAYRPLSAKSFVQYTWDGDMHYYLQYDGNAPYQLMHTKEMLCRFISEIGFQSYPSIKTLREYMDEEDLAPYSEVMLAHQKCFEGNQTIELYMKRDYVVPERFEDYVYLSQVQAAEIMRYTVEYQRRHNDYNRGVILWQLNDCWPVVSWSGVDYKGRWKAEQYMIRKFFAPQLVTSEVEAGEVRLYAVSDQTEEKNMLEVRLYQSKELTEAKEQVFTWKIGNQELMQLPVPEDRTHSCLAFRDQTDRAFKVQLFCLPKEFAFEKPTLLVELTENSEYYFVTITSDVICKDVMIDLTESDAVLSDNFFDLVPREAYTVEIRKDQTNLWNLEALRTELVIKTLNEVLLNSGKE